MLHCVHGCRNTCSILSPLSTPLHLQCTYLLWCKWLCFAVEHGIWPLFIQLHNWEAVRVPATSWPAHGQISCNECQAANAAFFFNALFHFSCWRTVEAADVLPAQHFIQSSPTINPSSLFSPSCPSPFAPPPPRTNFDVKEPVKDARAPSGSIFTKRQWVTVEPYLMQLHSMLEWGDPKKSLLCHHKISAEPGKEAELRLKYAVMQGSPASHTSFSCTQ
jgi:hypothetical protein